jgi:hypothetical protein
MSCQWWYLIQLTFEKSLHLWEGAPWGQLAGALTPQEVCCGCLFCAALGPFLSVTSRSVPCHTILQMPLLDRKAKGRPLYKLQADCLLFLCP